MALLDFRVSRDGALIYESVSDEADLIAVDPIEAIEREIPDVIDPDVERYAEQAPVPVAAVEAPPKPEIVQAMKQYDGIDCYVKLTTKLSPIYAKVNALKDLQLKVEDKASMLNIIDQIQSTTSEISNTVISMLSKMRHFSAALSNDYWIYKDIFAAAGFLTMNMPEIISKGLGEYTYTVHKLAKSLQSVIDATECLITRDEVIRKYVISIEDLINAEPDPARDLYNLRDMSIDTLVETLLNTNTTFNLIQGINNTRSIEDLLTWIKRAGIRRYSITCCNCTSSHEFIDVISCHIRWIMTESYAMLCDLCGDSTIDSEVFLNISMRLCATVCNLFYLCTLELYGMATMISNYVADKEAAENQISLIKHEVIKA